MDASNMVWKWYMDKRRAAKYKSSPFFLAGLTLTVYCTRQVDSDDVCIHVV